MNQAQPMHAEVDPAAPKLYLSISYLVILNDALMNIKVQCNYKDHSTMMRNLEQLLAEVYLKDKGNGVKEATVRFTIDSVYKLNTKEIDIGPIGRFIANPKLNIG